MLGGNSHQAHFFFSVLFVDGKSLKLVHDCNTVEISCKAKVTAAANPIQTPKTMYSNNGSGRAGRHGRTGARGPGKGRMPGFRSTIHYNIQTKGP